VNHHFLISNPTRNTCKPPKLPGNTDTPGILYTSLTKQKHRTKRNYHNFPKTHPYFFFGVFWCRVFFPTHNHHCYLTSPAVVSRGNGENSNLFSTYGGCFPTHLVWGNDPSWWDFLGIFDSHDLRGIVGGCFPTHLKNLCTSQIGSFPQRSGWKYKCLSFHHPVFVFNLTS